MLNHRSPSTWLGIAALSIVFTASRDAPAHVDLLDALPADGAVVARTPERVVIRFSDGIDSRSTRTSVIGPTGSSSLLIEGSGGEPMRELSIAVPDQGRGRYLVRWEIVGSDGDRVTGKVRFLVRSGS